MGDLYDFDYDNLVTIVQARVQAGFGTLTRFGVYGGHIYDLSVELLHTYHEYDADYPYGDINFN